MGRKSSEKTSSHCGSAMVRITNRFVSDLNRIAELDIKMTEYDELGKLLKLKKEKEKMIPKVVDKNRKIRAKRKITAMCSRAVILTSLFMSLWCA